MNSQINKIIPSGTVNEYFLYYAPNAPTKIVQSTNGNYAPGTFKVMDSQSSPATVTMKDPNTYFFFKLQDAVGGADTSYSVQFVTPAATSTPSADVLAVASKLQVPFRYPQYPDGGEKPSYLIPPVQPKQVCAIPGDYNKINYSREDGTQLGVYAPGQSYKTWNELAADKKYLIPTNDVSLVAQQAYAANRNFVAYQGSASSEIIPGYAGTTYGYTTDTCNLVWDATPWGAAQPVPGQFAASCAGPAGTPKLGETIRKEGNVCQFSCGVTGSAISQNPAIQWCDVDHFPNWDMCNQAGNGGDGRCKNDVAMQTTCTSANDCKRYDTWGTSPAGGDGGTIQCIDGRCD